MPLIAPAVSAPTGAATTMAPSGIVPYGPYAARPTETFPVRTSPALPPLDDRAAPLDPILLYSADGSYAPLDPCTAALDPRLAGAVAAARDTFRSQFFPDFGPLLYGGKRDLYKALGYPHDIFTWHYRTWYERGDIAARLVEFYPQSTWLPSVSVNEVDDPDITTEFEDVWAAFNRRLNVVADVFLRADILACTFRYSVILIGAPGELNTPLPRGNGHPDAIRFLTVLPEDRAYITQVVGQNGVDENGATPGSPGYIDPVTSPRFGMPLTYKCKLGIAANYFTSDGTAAFTGFLAEKEVHWSRIWHVAQGCLDNKIYGQPMLRRVANALIDYYKLRGAVAEGVWRWASPKIHADLDPTMQLLPEEEEEYRQGIEGLRHGQEDTLRTRGVTLKALYAPVVEMSQNIMTLIRSIGAAHGVPARVLSGSEEAKAAGAQDDKHTNDRQTERWGNYATPQLSGFLLYLADNGYMPKPKQLTVKWPEIEEHTEAEKAAIANAISLANANQKNAGDDPVMSSSELRAELWGRHEPAPVPVKAVEPASPADPNADPNAEPANEPHGADNPAAETTKILRAANDGLPSRRVVIIGGPRRGKSTMARELRAVGIPTYCGDPRSAVKEPEDGVTYLPEGLAWSESSAYIAENWLTAPGPWCCEGVAMARAVRKLVGADMLGVLDGAEIVVLTDPAEGAQESPGQAVMAKGVATVWAEVADLFPQARIVSGPAKGTRASAAEDGSWRVSMPAGRTAVASRKNVKSSPRYCFRVL